MTLTTESIGNWIFECQGMGEVPKKFETTFVSSQIDSITQFFVRFRNPFSFNILAQLSLETPEYYQENFHLMQKKQQVTI